MNHKKTDHTIWLVTGLVAVIAVAALLIFGGPADAHRKAPTAAQACFPLKLWDAHPADRPCHSINRVFEDGSGHLRLGTARRAMAWCSLPSVYELKPHQTFTIRCRSNGNAGAKVRPGRKARR